jgi:hypothetical protein
MLQARFIRELKRLSHIQFFSKVTAVTAHTPANTRITEIQHSIKFLHGIHKEIVLQWIPSHYRTEGCKLADVPTRTH